MEGKLYIGIDLCTDYTQIVCISDKFKEPQSLGKDGPAESFLIPTDGFDVASLTTLLRNTLNLTRLTAPDDVIAYVCVTIEKNEASKSELLKKNIQEAMAAVGIKDDRLTILSHTESLLAYVINQKRMLWQNDVALFEFRGEALTYVQMAINHKLTPMIAEIKEVSYEKELCRSDTVSKPSDASQIFEEVALRAIDSSIISTIYVAGRGFEGNFADEVLVKLASGRKVYKGQNLYAKGACYKAKEIALGEETLVSLLDSEMTPAEVRLKTYYDGKESELTISAPAKPYKEAGGEYDMILDDTNKLELRVIDVRSGIKSRYDFYLEGLPVREKRMTRIHLNVHFTGAYTCRIDVRDLGFGTYYRPVEEGEGVCHEWSTTINI